MLLAAPAVTRVFVVTADDEIAARMSALGAHIIREQSVPRDSGPEPSDPLNSAIRQGIAAARAALPASNLAVVTGDLPALTVADVEHALALAAAHERSMIPDEEGAGTTALLARAGIDFTPQFGAGSRVAHETAGHTPLPIPPTASIRRDVDTVANLAEALHLGVGAYTSALIASTSRAMTAVEETSRIQSATAADRMPPAASAATADASVSSTSQASSTPGTPPTPTAPRAP